MPAATRLTGSISEWNDERGFGFIAPGDGAPRVFVHISAFPPTRTRPFVGESVGYVVERAPDGRLRAAEVTSARVARVQKARRRGKVDVLSIIVVLAFAAIFAIAVVSWNLPSWVVALYLSTSILSMIAYANDKRAAKTGGWRERESTLLFLGLIGGWPGSIIAQQTLRHKTVKAGFVAQFWLTVAANLAAFLAFAYPGLAEGVGTALFGTR